MSVDYNGENNYPNTMLLPDFAAAVKRNFDAVAAESAEKIGTEKIADKAVTTQKISDYAVGQQQLAQACVSNNRIQNGAVDTRTIADEAVTDVKLSAALKEKISDIGSLARRVSELELSKMQIYDEIPEEHAGDLLVEETGIYIDGLITHSNGVSGPGALFVFADPNGIDIYRFYLSHAEGLYVNINSEWQFTKCDLIETDNIANGAITAEKLDRTYALSRGCNDVDMTSDLNSIRTNGIYSVYAGESEAENRHFPMGTGERVGTLIVCENLDGVTQMYVNYAKDGSNDPFIAIRTLWSNGWVVDSDWKFIKPNEMIKYDTVPQKIGTWIDGTPVWRAVFTESFENFVSSDVYLTVFPPVTNPNYGFVVNAFVVAQQYETPCSADDIVLRPHNEDGLYGCNFFVPDYISSSFKGYYGYVDFVCPEKYVNFGG